MTNEEAIRLLTKDKEYCIAHPIECGENAYKAYEMAIEALEKQIPQSPTMWGDGYCDGELVMESYECPNCGCIYDFDTDGKLNYCHNCGQAIDWSDEQ